MTKPLKNIWNDIKLISETQEGRQALMSSGSMIAAAYLGYIGPELFLMMHDTLALYSAKYPFLDPAGMATSLWDGAKYFSASVLDAFGGILEGGGIDISHNVREALSTGREFLSRYGDRTVEASRAFVDEVSYMVGSQLSSIAGAAQEMASSTWESIKEVWAPALVVIGAAKEAFEYFEIGKKVYGKWTSWSKKASSQETESERNLEVNTAIAGDEALTKADAEVRQMDVPKKVSANRTGIIWISERLHHHLNEEAADLPQSSKPDTTGIGSPMGYRAGHDMRPDQKPKIESAGSHKIDVDILLETPGFSKKSIHLSKIRLEIADPGDKLRSDLLPSNLSEERLEGMRKTPTMVRDITSSNAFIKGDARRSMHFHDLRRDAANDTNYYPGPDDGPGLI